ncbi:hypothetical protein B1757_06860 [Acidithiobacillus marinus]|uniref:Uncharacterized protein n=1 Tax=Acidithiobacillus marinus TaxID=187490 RepID=A0A2I1DMC1_9PROT|nr:hypothetical protein [Acidithiobacillus marinus]PKY11025.1 hypothetical protein B1757_06860 [Acidithiobacillus marinus]
MPISHQLTQIAYMDALQHLLIGFLLLAISLLALAVALYAWWKHRQQPENDLWSLSWAISSIIAAAFFALSLLFLANLWNWVGINHPSLLAAKQQISRAQRPRPLL